MDTQSSTELSPRPLHLLKDDTRGWTTGSVQRGVGLVSVHCTRVCGCLCHGEQFYARERTGHIGDNQMC